MSVEYSNESLCEPALEFLARELNVSIDDVSDLYTKELAKLEIGAHIPAFIPVIAIRHVREILRGRHSDSPVLA